MAAFVAQMSNVIVSIVLGHSQAVWDSGEGRWWGQSFRKALEHSGRRQHDLDHPGVNVIKLFFFVVVTDDLTKSDCICQRQIFIRVSLIFARNARSLPIGRYVIRSPTWVGCGLTHKFKLGKTLAYFATASVTKNKNFWKSLKFLFFTTDSATK